MMSFKMKLPKKIRKIFHNDKDKNKIIDKDISSSSSTDNQDKDIEGLPTQLPVLLEASEYYPGHVTDGFNEDNIDTIFSPRPKSIQSSALTYIKKRKTENVAFKEEKCERVNEQIFRGDIIQENLDQELIKAIENEKLSKTADPITKFSPHISYTRTPMVTPRSIRIKLSTDSSDYTEDSGRINSIKFASPDKCTIINSPRRTYSYDDSMICKDGTIISPKKLIEENEEVSYWMKSLLSPSDFTINQNNLLDPLLLSKDFDIAVESEDIENKMLGSKDFPTPFNKNKYIINYENSNDTNDNIEQNDINFSVDDVEIIKTDIVVTDNIIESNQSYGYKNEIIADHFDILVNNNLLDKFIYKALNFIHIMSLYYLILCAFDEYNTYYHNKLATTISGYIMTLSLLDIVVSFNVILYDDFTISQAKVPIISAYYNYRHVFRLMIIILSLELSKSHLLAMEDIYLYLGFTTILLL